MYVSSLGAASAPSSASSDISSVISFLSGSHGELAKACQAVVDGARIGTGAEAQSWMTTLFAVYTAQLAAATKTEANGKLACVNNPQKLQPIIDTLKRELERAKRDFAPIIGSVTLMTMPMSLFIGKLEQAKLTIGSSNLADSARSFSSAVSSLAPPSASSFTAPPPPVVPPPPADKPKSNNTLMIAGIIGLGAVAAFLLTQDD